MCGEGVAGLGAQGVAPVQREGCPLPRAVSRKHQTSSALLEELISAARTAS